MTVGEYEGAKKKEDSIVISVKHKTADTHSPGGGGGGTPIHYLYEYVPPNGVVILKLLI